MAGNPNATGHDAFAERVLVCVEDIGRLLPGLSRRYDMTVITGALAEQVGSALQALISKNVCHALQAAKTIEHIESAAFLQKTTQPTIQAASPDPGTPPDTPAAGMPPAENSTRH
jgi:hypothetical protein